MESNDPIRTVIENEIAAELKKIGDFTWAYVVMEKKSMLLSFYATTYPEEWVKHYYENNLQCTDPVVITALKRLTPFAWNEQIRVENYHHGSDLLAKAAQHTISGGYTFVLHDYNNNLAMLSLLINKDVSEDILHLVQFHQSQLNLFLAAVHEKYLSLALSSQSEPASATLFTTRENAILYWASVGKTYEETGLILGIKTTTVKFHMANIVKKLGVNNARQAVCLGVELKLVKPVQ
ncbi:LuxR family transcriptional regulator [Erwinia sp. DT-104]|uniref:LuxR family transcriptional regulator n=1 Tax=Erwinia plantamica TaxID=3237104 RepID=A0ABW7CF17_9GAMM|nr:LuxR family transcriptional regulator [Erwinia sp. PsM31]MDN4627061.1 LuxR family transcriptional regulator [Erwinia sp. PsM31]